MEAKRPLGKEATTDAGLGSRHLRACVQTCDCVCVWGKGKKRQHEAKAHCRERFQEAPEARASATGLGVEREACTLTSLVLTPASSGESEEPPAPVPAHTQLRLRSPESGVTDPAPWPFSLQHLCPKVSSSRGPGAMGLGGSQEASRAGASVSEAHQVTG